MDISWLVVLTILKNIGQWEGLSHILWKIIQMFQTTNQEILDTNVSETNHRRVENIMLRSHGVHSAAA